jgi:tetratricopeptide (TPR) repeat protein
MILALMMLFFGQVSPGPVCTPPAEPGGPEASARVEEALLAASNSVGERKTKLAAAGLQLAKQSGDAVGEAEADFTLAKLEFEVTGKWPARYLDAAVSVCHRAGCGPELIEALLTWSSYLQGKNSFVAQAVDVAIGLAREERHRPMTALYALLSGADSLQFFYPEATSRIKAVAAALLLSRAAAARQERASLREAQASAIAGFTLQDADRQAALDAYAEASTGYTAAGCGPENISALLHSANILIDLKPANTKELDELLGRALSIAESDRSGPAEIVRAMGTFQEWRQVPVAISKRHVRIEANLALQNRQAAPFELDLLGGEAEGLGEYELAGKLYERALRQTAPNASQTTRLKSLARVTARQGHAEAANDYQRRALEGERLDAIRREHGTPDDGLTTGGGGGGGENPLDLLFGKHNPVAGSKPKPSPWNPPERPGSEGATPGRFQTAPSNP